METQLGVSVLGGLVGGLASGVVLWLFSRWYARREAERFIRQQLDAAEARVRGFVTETVFGQITRVLEKTERVGLIVQRVVEIVQLSIGGRMPAPAAAGAADSPIAAVHAALGSALAQLGRPEEARKAFEEALRLDPAQPSATAGLQALARG